jgi:predicted AlkP superfamily phosphohydrolase/phosphomutase
MDPGFVERHWSALPNLARLRDEGHFSRLGTTTPPQSPVAWSTFITGLDPVEHGMFDFVHRDPQTLQPFSSMSRTEEPPWTFTLGPYILPLSRSRVVSLRRGTPFWQLLSQHGIPVTVLRMPTNYPPAETGTALSGMGTPDLRGTLGTFSFYTDDPEELSRSIS